MRVALFVPCYIDQLFPQVAIATLEVLERLGCTVAFPPAQTCCGQPLANAGFEADSTDVMTHFVDTFAGYDYVVAPSGSCVHHVRAHYDRLPADDATTHVRSRTYELCQFLHEVLEVDRVEARFPHRVGLHASCHGLRGLRLGRSSELQAPAFDVVRALLSSVEGLELVELDRADECCGFGGTFAVTQEAVSAKMGRDRLRDHARHGAEVVTATDMSCLMHLRGLAERRDAPLRFLHVAEILNGATL